MLNKSHKILWIDDEIEALKSHVFALRAKNYEITTVSNGHDAISLVKEGNYDAVLLDQVMPGLDGMKTLEQIKEIAPVLPIIMVTQSSEDQLIDEALSKKVDDFLIKPLSPSQISSTLKRILERDEIVYSKIPQKYAKDFNYIVRERQKGPDWKKWIDIYVKLAEWDLTLDKTPDMGLEETRLEQKKECNKVFSEHVERNYVDWVNNRNSPMLSVDVFDEAVIPLLQEGKQVFFIVVDCLRLDQWLTIEPILREYFRIERDYYYSILPTATLYSRNAIFSGMFPLEIYRNFPDYWQETSKDGASTNRYEKQMMYDKLSSYGLDLTPSPRYFKVFDAKGGDNYIRQASSFDKISLAALVIDFVDILVHKRSESDLLQEIAPDEAGFRSLTKSWFIHSSFFEILKIISKRKDINIVLTSDHGSILGNRASKVFGTKETTTGLRFKMGTNLGCNSDEAVYITNPKRYKLPAEIINKNYIIAKEDYYLVYPNQFHEYKRQFKGGFQHGGISMEEMILPLITMKPI